MPFADKRSLITQLLQVLGKCSLSTIRPYGVVYLASQMTVVTGEHYRPAGSTDRVGDETVGKTNPLLGQTIQIGSLNEAIIIGAHGLIGMVISHDEDDVRSLILLRLFLLGSSATEMGIDKDMDLVYDLKMLDEGGELKTKYRKNYENMYGRMNPEQKATWDAYYRPIIKNFMGAGLDGEELARWKYQRYMEDYLKCVRSVDDNVGRLLDYLDENGLAENTLVVYTSDQGFYMGEHGWFDKRFMYEESLRTPLVMRFPKGFKKKGDIEALVQNIDYAPTLLDFMGAEIPADMQGLSLKSLLEGKSGQLRDAIYYHYYEFPNEHMVKRHYGIRTDRYKLIHFYNDIDQWELYDLEDDPGEMENLYGLPESEELIVSLKARLGELQVEYDDLDKSTY